MLPITVYGRLLGTGGGASCKEGGIMYMCSSSGYCPKHHMSITTRRVRFQISTESKCLVDYNNKYINSNNNDDNNNNK